MFLTSCKTLTVRSFVIVPLFALMLCLCSGLSNARGDEFSPPTVQNSLELQTNLNAFCWKMWKTYNDESEEFYDAYREAYELLQLSKKINTAASTSGSTTNVKRWMLEIDAEIHHVEHHLGEFADRLGVPATDKASVVTMLEKVEDSLGSLMDKLGMERHAPEEHGDHEGHEVEAHEAADFAKAAVSAGELQSLANAVCVAMNKDYNNESLEFLDIYKDAYELMLSAKSLKAKLESVNEVDEVQDMVAALDGKIHRVESSVSSFVERTEVANELARSELLEKIDAVEIKLHSLKREITPEVAHDHDDDHKHGETTIKYEGSTADLATELAIAATSLSRAMEHNYKQNADFPEAFDEINEFRDTCTQISTMIVNDQIPDDCKRLIAGLDGEIHHLEEHVKNFSRDDTQSQDQYGRAERKFIQVEQFLHVLMARAGIESKHVD